MKLGLFLFLVSLYGLILNRKNLILMILSLEILLLAVTLIILSFSYHFNDLQGLIYSLLIIAIAGAETAIGLSILITFYKHRGTIAIKPIESFKDSPLLYIHKLKKILSSPYGGNEGINCLTRISIFSYRF